MSYPMPEVRVCGPEDQSHVQARQLHGCRRTDRRPLLTFKVRRGGCEEIPLIQGKRNPSKTVGVAGGHQRADILKP